MTPVHELRPMAMGELIDRSASFWRSHLKAMFRISLGFQVAQYVILKAYVFAMAAWFPLMRGGPQMATTAESDPGEVFRQIGWGTLSLFGALPVYFLIAWLAGMAVARYATPALLGQPYSVADAFARTRARVLPAVGGFLLSLVWLTAVVVLVLLPGVCLIGLAAFLGSRGSMAAAATFAVLGAVAVGLGLLVALVSYPLRFFLSSQVLAMEELGAVAALRRSGELMSGRIGPGFGNLVNVRASILITVVAIILTAVGLLSGLPALIIQFAFGKPFDPANADPDAVPQALLIPAELLQVLTQSAVGPLFAVFGVLFYLDLRIRREGLDLELKLGRLPPVSG